MFAADPKGLGIHYINDAQIGVPIAAAKYGLFAEGGGGDVAAGKR